VKNRIRQINTLHALFVHQGHTTIVKKNLATIEKRQEAVKVLTGLEREESEWIVKYLELQEQRIKELKGKMQNGLFPVSKTHNLVVPHIKIKLKEPLTAIHFNAIFPA